MTCAHCRYEGPNHEFCWNCGGQAPREPGDPRNAAWLAYQRDLHGCGCDPRLLPCASCPRRCPGCGYPFHGNCERCSPSNEGASR